MIDFGFGVSLGSMDYRDIELARSTRNQYDVYQYCRQQDLISESQQRDWFCRQGNDPSVQMYRISIGDDHNFAGVCGLTNIDRIHRRAEFSLYLTLHSQGLGFGQAALMTLLSHGFSTFGLQCIWGECFEGNLASNLFKKIGMVFEGTRRDFYWKGGKFIDAHLYSMLFSEWENNAQFDNHRQQLCSMSDS